MRLTEEQVARLKCLIVAEAGGDARLYLFGSRVDDTARGGDVDLLLQLPRDITNPALLTARVAARASRLLDGRHVDVVLLAPNLKHLPIHDSALRTGIQL